ncbi:MAG: hypothetical protein SW833_08945 [Cyanobacteriota bacterium]|nr:hypothetical protein [Cyanobacteriota bacterium]
MGNLRALIDGRNRKLGLMGMGDNDETITRSQQITYVLSRYPLWVRPARSQQIKKLFEKLLRQGTRYGLDRRDRNKLRKI